MLEIHRISKSDFAKLYSNYIMSCINKHEVANPLKENIFLVKGNNVVDTTGKVIGKVVD